RETALHAAAYRGDPELVDLLIQHGAPLDVTDSQYGTPPMVWALHAWIEENRPDSQPYVHILLALANAGATVKKEWLEKDRVRAESALYATLHRAAGGEPAPARLVLFFQSLPNQFIRPAPTGASRPPPPPSP